MMSVVLKTEKYRIHQDLSIKNLKGEEKMGKYILLDFIKLKLLDGVWFHALLRKNNEEICCLILNLFLYKRIFYSVPKMLLHKQ